MKKAEMQAYKKLLLAVRARLRGQVNHMADAALGRNGSDASGELSKMPIHMADLGTENFEQEFTLGLLENEEETLRKIEASLEQIEDGTYGDCEECGAKIPKARLEAVPYAALCVKCASESERG
jgi:DnaK suppressor protein